MSVGTASSTDAGKVFATLAARLALAGYSLHNLADGGYLVTRWNFSARLPSLHAVGQLIEQIGGQQ